jgi:uncharacterized protein
MMEYKSFDLLETKSEASGFFSGYAATYIRDAYGDRIQPGAFGETISEKKGKIPIFVGHSSDAWVGFSTALSEDHKGLRLEGQLILDTSGGRDAFALLKAADEIGFKVGLSIGFRTLEWELEDEGRILKAIDLWETSITPFPANSRARVTEVRSIRETERLLRDAIGLPAKEAKQIVYTLSAAGLFTGVNEKPPVNQRDVGLLRQVYRDTELRSVLREQRSLINGDH